MEYCYNEMQKVRMMKRCDIKEELDTKEDDLKE